MLHYRSLTREILDHQVEGVGIKKGPLRKQYHPDKPVLMVFLRHLGCQFCKETVRDIRAASTRNPDYPDVLFFYQEDIAAGQAFFNRYWPRAKAISDPKQFFYKEFGIPGASFMNLVSPGALLSRIRATLKGNFDSFPKGNFWQMPGFFVVKGEQIVWSHDYRHVGDEPPLRRLNQLLQSLDKGKSTARPLHVRSLERAG